MGLVYLAHEPGVERDVALKVIRGGKKSADGGTGTTSRRNRGLSRRRRSRAGFSTPASCRVPHGARRGGSLLLPMRPITEGRTLADVIAALANDDRRRRHGRFAALPTS